MDRDPVRLALLARAFDHLGQRWTALLMARLLEGPSGFVELARSIDGITDSVLATRLRWLRQDGLITRTVHHGPPVRVTYAVTDAGSALLPVLCSISRWADAHVAPGGPVTVRPAAPGGMPTTRSR